MASYRPVILTGSFATDLDIVSESSIYLSIDGLYAQSALLPSLSLTANRHAHLSHLNLALLNASDASAKLARIFNSTANGQPPLVDIAIATASSPGQGTSRRRNDKVIDLEEEGEEEVTRPGWTHMINNRINRTGKRLGTPLLRSSDVVSGLTSRAPSPTTVPVPFLVTVTPVRYARALLPFCYALETRRADSLRLS